LCYMYGQFVNSDFHQGLERHPRTAEKDQLEVST